MVTIPPGCFWRGTNVSRVERQPRHRVCISTFKIDRSKVTVKDYRQCVKANRCSHPNPYNYHWGRDRTCNWGRKDRDLHPINCVDWKQARRYCRWVKRRLPTEAEWEYAALGSDGRVLPWGNNRNFFCSYAIVRDPRNNRMGCGRGGTWPINSRPSGVSPFGVMSMIGNALEWVADCWEQKYYRRSPRVDPANLRCPHGRARQIRGASWMSMYNHVDAQRRWPRKPSLRLSSIGFRCAK